jgi:predicted dehydrogenase
MGHPRPLRVSGAASVNFAKGWEIPGMWGEWDRERFSVEDFATGLVHFEGGATLVLETAWLGHQTEKEDLGCQVFGTKGGVKWPGGEFATVTGRTLSQGTLISPWDIRQPHTEVLRAFRDCVAGGTPSPVPWAESLKAIAILEAVYRSWNERKEVEIEPADPYPAIVTAE